MSPGFDECQTRDIRHYDIARKVYIIQQSLRGCPVAKAVLPELASMFVANLAEKINAARNAFDSCACSRRKVWLEEPVQAGSLEIPVNGENRAAAFRKCAACQPAREEARRVRDRHRASGATFV